MRRPNILMITCHDLGRHLHCYGVDTVHSPNLDRLAERGVRFSRCYSTSSVCSPARGSLHTGRYPQSNGLMGLTHKPFLWKLRDDERHSAQLFGEQGYRTCLIGLQHIDPDWRRLGYDEHLSPQREAAETVAETKRYLREAAGHDVPFFAKVGFSEVHRVGCNAFNHGRDEERGVYVPPWLQETEIMREDFAEFQAIIRAFDGYVGEILAALEASDVAEHTLVVMTSDHGMPHPGAKWCVRTAGIEVPLILWQPGTRFTGGEVIDALISHVDILPTLLDYAGLPIYSRIQGKSFLPWLTGQAEAPPRTACYSQFTADMKRDNLSRAITVDGWHLIHYFDQGRPVAYPADVNPQRFAKHVERCATSGQMRPFAELYDLTHDPHQLHDLSGEPEHQERLRELKQQLLAWMREVGDALLEGPLRTPYYDQAMAYLLADG